VTYNALASSRHDDIAAIGLGGSEIVLVGVGHVCCDRRPWIASGTARGRSDCHAEYFPVLKRGVLPGCERRCGSEGCEGQSGSEDGSGEKHAEGTWWENSCGVNVLTVGVEVEMVGDVVKLLLTLGPLSLYTRNPHHNEHHCTSDIPTEHPQCCIPSTFTP
jgi:hypothetical protein